MCVGESDGTFGEAVEVGRLDVGVVVEGGDVVVEVVDGDEEDVGFGVGLSEEGGCVEGDDAKDEKADW